MWAMLAHLIVVVGFSLLAYRDDAGWTLFVTLFPFSFSFFLVRMSVGHSFSSILL